MRNSHFFLSILLCLIIFIVFSLSPLTQSRYRSCVRFFYLFYLSYLSFPLFMYILFHAVICIFFATPFLHSFILSSQHINARTRASYWYYLTFFTTRAIPDVYFFLSLVLSTIPYLCVFLPKTFYEIPQIGRQ